MPGQLLAVRGCLFPSQNSQVEIPAHRLCTHGILVAEWDDMAGRRVLATEPGGGPRDMDAGSSHMKVSCPETAFRARSAVLQTLCGDTFTVRSLGRSLTWALRVWPHHWYTSKAPGSLDAARREQQWLRV